MTTEAAARRVDGGVTIGICTYRRPMLADTLASLARIDCAGREVKIVVADNDTVPSAAPVVGRAAKDHPLPVRLLHAPANNISVARNALLTAARMGDGRWLVFIDDDERAEPDWLARLFARQAESGAGVVLGPVRAEYGDSAPAWMRRARPHDVTPVFLRGGRIATGYSGNALIDLADPALRGLSFDLARGRSGGEDTAFFAAFARAGGRIAYAPDAVLHEAVPPERASLRWLLSRRYRMGQTHAALLGAEGSATRVAAQVALASAKAAACCGLACLRLTNAAERNRQLVRSALHVGVVARLLGGRDMEIYATNAANVRGRAR